MQTTAVSRKRAVSTDHAMAGNNDGHWVPMVGLADGAKRFWRSHFAGQISIGASAAVRDAAESIPTFLLKFGADKVECKCKVAQLAFKVRTKLFNVRFERVTGFNPALCFIV